MGPKSKKTSAAEKAKDVQETEDPLQAVCLLPLANTPLIEYTLEFLASVGVDEVYIYCGAHTEQVEEYVQQSRWARPTSPFRTELIRSTSRSIGDAMRDLDKRATLSNDFIVVYGDVVSNLPIHSALAQHRARRAKDKNAIMTMVLREVSPTHRSKVSSYGASEAPVFVIDPSKNRCVHYEQISPHASGHHVSIDPELLQQHQELDLRNDLIDCGIDICTPDVLALWSDNFDYEKPRRGFLHSVLKDYELNGKTIHTHIVKEKYAARVRNLRSYDAVSKDVLGRWAWPMGPDIDFGESHSYDSREGNIWVAKEAKISRAAVVGMNSAIGKGSRLAAGVKIFSSVVGSNCNIGKNCVLRGAHIWNGASVGEGTEIRNAIIAESATVGRKCLVEDGAVVSFGVRIGDGMTVKRGRRVSKRKRSGTNPPSEPNLVGADGVGHDFAVSDSEEEDARIGADGTFYQQNGQSISAESISTLNSESEPETESRPPSQRGHVKAGSFASISSEDGLSRSSSRTDTEFHADATSSIYDSLKRGDDIATVVLELQGLRMAANASQHQIRRAVVTAILKYACEVRNSGTALKSVLGKSSDLINRTLFDKEAEEKEDQVDFLLLAQADLAKRAEGEAVLLSLCNDSYLLDILEEEAFMQWWNSDKSSATEELRKVRGPTAKFIKALEEAESDSEEDDED